MSGVGKEISIVLGVKKEPTAFTIAKLEEFCMVYMTVKKFYYCSRLDDLNVKPAS